MKLTSPTPGPPCGLILFVSGFLIVLAIVMALNEVVYPA